MYFCLFLLSNGTAHLESPETTPTKAPERVEVGIEITRDSPISDEVVQPPAPVIEDQEPEPEEEQPEPEEPVDKGNVPLSLVDSFNICMQTE